MTTRILLLPLACFLVVLSLSAAADPPAKKASAADAVLVVIDSGGKEQKLKTWKFALGTRRLSWLDEKEAKGKAGPEALEFRDEHSTTFIDGIVTLIPLERIRSIDYDGEKVTLKSATSDKPEADLVLTGTTKFKGINKLTIEAEIDMGAAGIAEIKFLGGVPNKGIRGIRFPTPKAPDAPSAGRGASITSADKGKDVQKAADLQPLYRLSDGSRRVLPTLMFKKTLKLDLTKISKVHAVEAARAGETDWAVTFKTGEEQTLTLLRSLPIEDKPAILEGLLGRVRAGWKLFPVHTIADIQFEEEKKE